MSKNIRTIHTIDLNNPQTVNGFLRFLVENKAKVLAWNSTDSASNVRSILTIYRIKTESKDKP